MFSSKTSEMMYEYITLMPIYFLEYLNLSLNEITEFEITLLWELRNTQHFQPQLPSWKIVMEMI